MRQLKMEWDAVLLVEEEESELELTGQHLAVWQRLVLKVRPGDGAATAIVRRRDHNRRRRGT